LSAQTKRLARRLKAIPVAVKQAVVPSLIQSGNELAARMKHLAPKDTGALADSITVTPPGGTTPTFSQPGGSRTAAENQVLVTAGDEEVRYPHLVEYGHRASGFSEHDVPPHPFFWPAYRLSRKRIANRTKRAIRKAVREKWGTG
jgi:hypothetical protein